MFTLTPRFILSVRALYARDLRSRSGCGIDTGFGLSSICHSEVGGTAMVFADAGRDDEVQRDEEMSMEVGDEQLTTQSDGEMFSEV